MKHFFLFMAFSAILPAQTPGPAPPRPAVPAAPPADPNTVVISVGDHKITAAQYDKLVKTLPQQYQDVALGPGRRQFAQRIVELSILSDEALKQNIDKVPDVALQLGFQRDNLLAQEMFQGLIQAANVPDAEIQAYYDAHKSDYETLTARHILIRVKGAPMPAIAGRPELTDEEAKAKAESIRKRIVGGEDFAAIAKAESDDPQSGEKGGDLGEFKKGMMVPPFEQAAYALKPGDISEPVQTPFGYHIIQVQTHVTKSLAEVTPQILAQLKPDMARKAVAALVGRTAFVINDGFFGPDPAAAIPPKPPAVPPAAR